MSARVCVGRILGVHGLRGLVKVQSFTAPSEVLFDYACSDDSGEGGVIFDASSLSRRGTYQGYPFFLVRIMGCDDRTQAETFKGKKLYISRAALPTLGTDDFYHDDLQCLKVQDEAGTPLGQVLSVHNFGAGDILEIKPPQGPSFFVRFVREHVVHVDVGQGTLTLSKDALAFKEALDQALSAPKKNSKKDTPKG